MNLSPMDKAHAAMFEPRDDDLRQKTIELRDAARLVLDQSDDGGYTEAAAIRLQEAIDACDDLD